MLCHCRKQALTRAETTERFPPGQGKKPSCSPEIKSLGFGTMKTNFKFAATVLMQALVIGATTSIATADETSFGGHAERFKGKGDRIPPHCVVDAPSGAESSFTIVWNCDDDYTPADEIRTELWIYRNGADVVGRQIEHFQGFPAASVIDATQLHANTIAEGLPARFRVVAMDRAGNTTTSPFISVGNRGNSLSSCDVEIVKEATESTGGSTGQPAKTATITSGAVTGSQTSDTALSVSTAEEATASPCEIEELCGGNEAFNFNAAISIQTDNSATAVFTVPSLLAANLTGTATVDGAIITRVDLSGETTLDGVKTTVSLSCVD